MSTFRVILLLALPMLLSCATLIHGRDGTVAVPADREAVVQIPRLPDQRLPIDASDSSEESQQRLVLIRAGVGAHGSGSNYQPIIGFTHVSLAASRRIMGPLSVRAKLDHFGRYDVSALAYLDPSPRGSRIDYLINLSLRPISQLGIDLGAGLSTFSISDAADQTVLDEQKVLPGVSAGVFTYLGWFYIGLQSSFALGDPELLESSSATSRVISGQMGVKVEL